MPLVAVLLLAAACDGSTSGVGLARTGRRRRPGDHDRRGAAGRATSRWSSRRGAHDLLVGSRAPEGSASRPRLTVLDPAGGSHEVEVTPVSPTAFQAKWLVAAPRGTAVDLVGGAPAGAHSNTRWSTWRGDAAAVRELPQPFATFGGWGAGALVSLVQTPCARSSSGRGRAAAPGSTSPCGTPTGERWVRASSAGTALASSAKALVSARGATADRAGLLVVGSVTLLGEGSVTQRRRRCGGAPGPTARGRAPTYRATARWGRPTRRPATRLVAAPSSARSTAPCGAGRSRADDTVTPLGLPTLAVGEHDLLTAPLLRGEESTVLSPRAACCACSRVSGGGSRAGAPERRHGIRHVRLGAQPARARCGRPSRTATGRLRRRSTDRVRRGPPRWASLDRGHLTPDHEASGEGDADDHAEGGEHGVRDLVEPGRGEHGHQVTPGGAAATVRTPLTASGSASRPSSTQGSQNAMPPRVTTETATSPV